LHANQSAGLRLHTADDESHDRRAAFAEMGQVAGVGRKL
jgi:hypothetical protein